MILSQIITRCLATRKRLVVPQLGAFLVKVPGREVVFSEMMKRDDGVLRSVLCTEEGMSEIEASGAIDRFVFEVRHAVESDTVFQAEGLGIFAAGPNGTVRFRFLPEPGFRPETAAANAPETEEPARAAAAEKSDERGEPGKAPAPAGAESPAAEAAPEPAGEPEPSEQREELAPDETRRRIRELMKHDGEHPSEGRSSSSPRRPDPSVRGLRYGKPLKTTDAYTFVGSAPSRRPDTFIILAVAAVVLGIGAILYGYLKDRRQERLEQQYVEQVASQGVDPVDIDDDGVVRTDSIGEGIR